MEIWTEKTFKNSDVLLREAIKEFSEQNYENASLNQILNSANMSKGVFYHHFHTKENLYLYCVGYYLNEKKSFLVNKYTPEDLQGDIFFFIKKSIAYSLEFAALDPYVRKFSDQLIKERGNAIYQKVMERFTIDNDTMLRGLVQSAIEQGDLREDFSVAFIGKLISHILSHVNEILDNAGVDDYLQRIDELLSFMEYGLRKKL